MSRPELPPEIWRYILSCLLEPYELLPICGVNRLFYDVAMDYRYGSLRMGFPSNAAVFKLRRARDPWLAKRVKSLYVSTDAIEVIFREQWSSWPLSRLRWWNAISSLLPDTILNWVASIEPAPRSEQQPRECTTTDAEDVSNLLLDAADGMANVEKLELRATIFRELEFELQFLQLLCSRLVHLQILTIWSDTHKLHLVLPVLQFCDLREVNLQLYGQPSVPSADAYSRIRRFLQQLAPTLERLTISTFDREVIEQLSSAFHEDVVMPKLHKLHTFLMIDDIQAIQSINANYPALTELSLTACTPTAAASLGYLQLAELRHLQLSLQHMGTTQGLWSGSSSFTRLEKLHFIHGYELSQDEVSQLCRFFRRTTITDLMLDIHILDGNLIDDLALSFPSLSTLALHAQHVSRADIPPPEVDLTPFEAEMQDRCYPDWRLSWVDVSLHITDWNNYTARMEAAQMVTSIVAQCIPYMNRRGGDEEER